MIKAAPPAAPPPMLRHSWEAWAILTASLSSGTLKYVRLIPHVRGSQTVAESQSADEGVSPSKTKKPQSRCLTDPGDSAASSKLER